MHIYDDRFPPARPAARHQADAHAGAYRLLQQRIGTTRTVIVTPAAYGTDNRVTLDAISQLGPSATRGIAVVQPTVTDAELARLHAAGTRGIRFSVYDPQTAALSVDMMEPLSRRVRQLGWHVQIHMRADQIVQCASLLERLPSPLVFDHMGRLPQPAGISHPAFAVLRRLIDRGQTWVKLSGAYQESRVGAPSYSDATGVARAFIEAAPERMVWGSDWPHPTENHKPDDAVLFDLLALWVPDENTRHRILVENPETLFGFPHRG
jgi:predicted TIM-barrel fold metal-dependent hydrolase